MGTVQLVKTLEICRVTPLTDSANSAAEFSLPLTYFDTIWIKFFPIERVFFYQLAPHESTHSFFNSVVLPKLKHSLSLTLAHFLPVAGNIIWPADKAKPSFLYAPNDGVSLIVAESKFDLNWLSQDGIQEAAGLHPYIPELPVSESKGAIIAFQITFFPSQGFSIGMCMHHAMFDGKSVALFMKSWAYMCKENSNTTKKQINSLPLELTPVFDRTILDDPLGLDMFYMKSWSSSSDPNPKSLKCPQVIRATENIVRSDFQLSRQDIMKLRRNIASQLDEKEKEDSKHKRLSTFLLSCTYIIQSIVKAKKLERKGKVGFMLAADCRFRLNLPLPTNYFGNCVIGNLALIDNETILDKNGIASVVNQLSETIEGLETRMKNMSIEKENEFILKYKNIVAVADLMIGVAGSPRFEIYGTDFGWGKPKKTQVVSIDKNVSISMAESRDGDGGLEIGLALKNNEMEMFSSIFLDGLRNM
ncbi:malonyl-CoA:anthocyanidin 5-O-glucoside-6''-O-malonyltransferase-like [Euphorbia lathyris]|uniref:malonyl-CoA:anthocyanidin 5-O-glucoside-6''-O-malonyltransferase-like n=1 Tax=Euphorbia lathyris TaxID=212925 RepID=UPI0033144651